MEVYVFKKWKFDGALRTRKQPTKERYLTTLKRVGLVRDEWMMEQGYKLKELEKSTLLKKDEDDVCNVMQSNGIAGNVLFWLRHSDNLYWLKCLLH